MPWTPVCHRCSSDWEICGAIASPGVKVELTPEACVIHVDAAPDKRVHPLVVQELPGLSDGQHDVAVPSGFVREVRC